MSEQDQNFRVLIAVFDRDDQATEALNQLREMAKEGLIELHDAATVSRGQDLKIRIKDLGHQSAEKDVGKGAVIGGVIGLIFPPSVIVTAGLGAAAGGLFGHFRNKGFDHKELERAGQDLKPGQAAVVAVARDEFVDQVTRGLKDYAKLNQYLMNAETGAVATA